MDHYLHATTINLPLEVNAKRTVRRKESSVDEIELIEVFEEKTHSRVVSLRSSHGLKRKEMWSLPSKRFCNSANQL